MCLPGNCFGGGRILHAEHNHIRPVVHLEWYDGMLALKRTKLDSGDQATRVKVKMTADVTLVGKHCVKSIRIMHHPLSEPGMNLLDPNHERIICRGEPLVIKDRREYFPGKVWKRSPQLCLPTIVSGKDMVRSATDFMEAQLGPVASDRIEFQVPDTFEGSGPVTIEVLMGGKISQTLRAHRAASSPTIYPDAAAKPAEPGETVTLTATGLGAAPTLRVLFDGQPGEVSSTGRVEGQPGRYRIQVVVPKDVNVQPGSSRDVPIALATPDSFIDLADLPVTRK